MTNQWLSTSKIKHFQKHLGSIQSRREFGDFYPFSFFYYYYYHFLTWKCNLLCGSFNFFFRHFNLIHIKRAILWFLSYQVCLFLKARILASQINCYWVGVECYWVLIVLVEYRGYVLKTRYVRTESCLLSLHSTYISVLHKHLPKGK